MTTSPRRWARLAIFAVLATAIAAAAFTGSSQSKAAVRHAMTPAVMQDPQLQFVAPATSGTVPFGCQTRPITSALSSCYGPDQIRTAYGVQPLLDGGVNGAGRSITIIDAYGSMSDIKVEMSAFDATFSLPDPPAFNVIYPDGPPDPTDVGNAFGWGAETALDTEWAHVIAPNATINLVVAKSNDDADILSATRYVAEHKLGDVLSQSYGESEACVNPSLLKEQSKLFAKMVSHGMTLLASAGDDGAGLPSCDGSILVKAVSSPAVDPNVTAVGGTQLSATPATRVPGTINTLDPGGVYQGETVWNEFATFGAGAATGGGVSSIFSKPSYQNAVASLNGSTMRWIPDIAYNAAIQGGVLTLLFCPAVVCGADQEAFFRVGGTSAGSPQWAGLVALAAQVAHGSIGALNPALYALGSSSLASGVFHDVTVGNNTVPAALTGTPNAITGYSAGAGWDAVTGWGTPKANALVPALAAALGGKN